MAVVYVAQFIGQLPSMYEVMVRSSALHKSSVMVSVCNPSTGDVEAGELQI